MAELREAVIVAAKRTPVGRANRGSLIHTRPETLAKLVLDKLLDDTKVDQKDIDDLRESPSIELIELLRKKGAKVDYNDPYIPKTPKQRKHNLKMVSKKLSAKMLAGYDIVLISTDHSDYDYNWIVQNAKLVIDTRNATANVRKNRRKIVKA